MKILLDTNVVLDIFLDRDPIAAIAAKVLRRAREAHVDVFLTATSITDLYYITREAEGQATALALISDLLQLVDVGPVNKATILSALHSEISDFEDAVQESAAIEQAIDILVTRNVRDFGAARIPVHTPESFLDNLT